MKPYILHLLVLFLAVTCGGSPFVTASSSHDLEATENVKHKAEEFHDDKEDGCLHGLTVSTDKACSHSCDQVKFSTAVTNNLVTTGGLRTGYSKQLAPQILVNSWNDLNSWQNRNESSSACEQDVERAIRDYLSNEMWALQLFDAWARPGPSVLQGRSAFDGSYYQCRETRAPEEEKRAGFTGNYCVVSLLNLSRSLDSVKSLKEPEIVRLGTCLPDSCSQDNVKNLFQERLQALNFNSFLMAASVDCRSDYREVTIFTRIAIAILIIIGTLTGLGTITDIVKVQWPNWSSPDRGQQNKQTKQGNWTKLLLSFSAWTNGHKLLSTSLAPGSVSAISGIRFLTMAWILFGHTFFFQRMYADNTFHELPAMLHSRFTDVLLQIHFGVDTFFAISGFLVSYHWIKPIINQGWKFNWKYFYLHRYWRLTPPCIITVVLIQGLQGFMVSGGQAPSLQPIDKLNCEDNWWLNLLYINNLFRNVIEEMCAAQTWSLAADMHFYILSPFMLMPFYYHRYAGILACLIFVVAQWTIAVFIWHHHQWQLGFISSPEDWWRYYYFPSYTRIAPFALGILAGYFLSVNGGRIKMRSWQVLAGWIFATTTGLTLIFGSHDCLSEICTGSILKIAISVTISRSIWGACVLWIIVACNSGYGGPVNAILSWSPFTVLGRVTYMGYLLHVYVLMAIFENLERSVYLSFTSLAVYGVAGLVFTCVVAAVFTICVEFPLLNLERNFFGKVEH